MGALIGLLSSAFGGSLIGGIGSFVQKWLDGKNDAKQMELQLQRDAANNAHELKMLELQLQNKSAVASVNADASVQKASYEALEASLAADKATYSNGDPDANSWLIAVDVIRGIMRPTITWALATYCVAVTAYNLVHYGANFPSEELAKITFALIDSMTTFTGVALTWWFGARPRKQQRGE